MDKDTNWQELKEALDGNYSNGDRRITLLKIKNAVIGSNRQKGALISSGLVPILLQLCTAQGENLDDKINALIILGSLAKGSSQQVQLLIRDYDIIPVLLNEIIMKNNDRKCLEVCLSTLRSLYEQPYASAYTHLTESCPITYFLCLASTDSSLKMQICVTSVLVTICQTYEDQIRLLDAGTIHILSRMICLENEQVQLPALTCLSCMCYANRSVTDNVCVTSYQGKSLPDILNCLLSRLYSPEIQLTAARCLTYVYRSGTLLSTDHRILQKTLPCLTRLCSDTFDLSIRADAAETLAYLIEVDARLQQTAAISNRLLQSLTHLLQSNQHIIKRSALKCFACLCANDETIRKRIMDTNILIDAILDSLDNGDSQVRLAAIMCLHSLSRSVQQLRTTFQDHAVWKPLLQIISNDPSIEFLQAVTSVICNLLLEFSPSKEPMFNAGITERLCQLTEHEQSSIRLNSIWALMNMSFQAEQRVRTDIFGNLGTKRILRLLSDTDGAVIMKTLGLLRNLLSKPHQIDEIMSCHSAQVLEVVHMIMESSHSSDIKEQVLCIVGNIAAGAEDCDVLLHDKKIMAHLSEYLCYQDAKLQAGALLTIHNIVHRNDCWSGHGKYALLKELNIIDQVYELNKQIGSNSEDYIHRTLKKIVIQCKKYFPNIK